MSVRVRTRINTTYLRSRRTKRQRCSPAISGKPGCCLPGRNPEGVFPLVPVTPAQGQKQREMGLMKAAIAHEQQRGKGRDAAQYHYPSKGLRRGDKECDPDNKAYSRQKYDRPTTVAECVQDPAVAHYCFSIGPDFPRVGKKPGNNQAKYSVISIGGGDPDCKGAWPPSICGIRRPPQVGGVHP